MAQIAEHAFAELEAGLDNVRRSPSDVGTVRMIVRRPATHEREAVSEAKFDLEQGLVGDNWRARGSRMTEDGSADRNAQVTVMNARAIALIAGSEEHWPPAGDQLFVDFDLSVENLPAGSKLEIGTALLEVSATPHTGCRLFAGRYGTDAVKFVNSPQGKQLRLRGLNARVIRPGTVPRRRRDPPRLWLAPSTAVRTLRESAAHRSRCV